MVTIHVVVVHYHPSIHGFQYPFLPCVPWLLPHRPISQVSPDTMQQQQVAQFTGWQSYTIINIVQNNNKLNLKLHNVLLSSAKLPNHCKPPEIRFDTYINTTRRMLVILYII